MTKKKFGILIPTGVPDATGESISEDVKIVQLPEGVKMRRIAGGIILTTPLDEKEWRKMLEELTMPPKLINDV